jgi:hypothetical protein
MKKEVFWRFVEISNFNFEAELLAQIIGPMG